ncbi:ABC transporter ATP-binding protein [Lactobacillus terrae]|uniref:ABC transporter ATP-binding protein n=1 Tax=Lactobacillus terrae TaxID=2269374 RepID=UPI000C1B7B9E|nr:ABC transporter ATP-binding protein [Lactobacillus terrae]
MERQRLGITRNILFNKQFLLIDELASGLDVPSAKTLEDDLFKLKIGFIYVSHDVSDLTDKRFDKIYQISNKTVKLI